MVLQGEAGAQGPDGERGLAGQDVSTKNKVQSTKCCLFYFTITNLITTHVLNYYFGFIVTSFVRFL